MKDFSEVFFVSLKNQSEVFFVSLKNQKYATKYFANHRECKGSATTTVSWPCCFSYCGAVIITTWNREIRPCDCMCSPELPRSTVNTSYVAAIMAAQHFSGRQLSNYSPILANANNFWGENRLTFSHEYNNNSNLLLIYIYFDNLNKCEKARASASARVYIEISAKI